jgi:hypothetical protein
MRKAGGATANQIVMTLSKGRAKSKTIERDFHSAVHSINSSGLA